MLFLQEMRSRRLFFDGAMGTQLQKLTTGDPMPANIREPQAVREIHRRYREAGSDVVTANTFGAYVHKYENFSEIIRAAVENARQAGEGFVALDMGPTGRLLKPMGDMGFDECYAIFEKTAKAGAACGADLILIETMTDLYETKAAALAAKATGLPVIATVSFDQNGRMLTGADIRAMAVLLEGLGVDALGVNCGHGPDAYRPWVEQLLTLTSLPVLAQPNAGLPKIVDGKAVYGLPPEKFANELAEMAKLGAAMLGGCCGTSPEHISALREACKGIPFSPRQGASVLRVSSGVRAVDVDGTERIAYRDARDIEGMMDEDADIIGITVSGADTVVDVQELIRQPLLLEAPSIEILREAVRVYNGRPMVKVMDKGLEKYGAVCTR